MFAITFLPFRELSYDGEDICIIEINFSSVQADYLPKMIDIGENIVGALAGHAHTRADHPAIEAGEKIISYRKLNLEVTKFAANLQNAGIGKGDVVGVQMPDTASHLVLICALARIGAVLFSVQPGQSEDEIAKKLQQIQAVAFVGWSNQSSLPGAINLRIDDIHQATDNMFEAVDVGGADPVVIIESSGTTGDPKTFVRSHGDMLALIDRYAIAQHWQPSDRFFSLTPFSFNIFRNIFIGMLQQGATTIVYKSRGKTRPEKFINFVASQKISYLKLTPMHMIPMLDYVTEKRPLYPDLRAMVVGSAPTSSDQRQLAHERLTPKICEQFATNETGLLAYAEPAGPTGISR